MATNVNPVNWFEIPANDLERAKVFYEHVLDIELALND
jgi:predicted enzyme related to lactoylglutathione lyase